MLGISVWRTACISDRSRAPLPSVSIDTNASMISRSSIKSKSSSITSFGVPGCTFLSHVFTASTDATVKLPPPSIAVAASAVPIAALAV